MKNKSFKDFLLTILILIISFFISLLLYSALDTQALVPALFVLAVFFVSLITDGYIWGVSSALISVLALNFAFTFPYFVFDFTIPENIVSAIIMIVVTVATSTLTTKIKIQKKENMQAEKEKMRANLLRAISHDLRTPLTSILGTSSTITENYNSLSDERKIDMLIGVKEDAQWLIRMVENLLSVTRIDTSNVKLIKSSVVLEELVDQVLEKFRKRYRNQEVKITMPEEFISVSCDALLIEQVLINLLENAVQHAKGMTELKLNIYPKNTRVIFEVTDDGCGIEKERLNDILSGYLISDKAPADSNKQNMGIGLSVCGTIIKAHGSEITVLNNKNNTGVTFRFSLETEEVEDE